MQSRYKTFCQRCLWCDNNVLPLHRLHIMMPAHKLFAISGGSPNLSMRYGACVHNAAWRYNWVPCDPGTWRWNSSIVLWVKTLGSCITIVLDIWAYISMFNSWITKNCFKMTEILNSSNISAFQCFWMLVFRILLIVKLCNDCSLTISTVLVDWSQQL